MSQTIEFPKRLILFPELKSIYGIGYTRTHLSRLERAGKFPLRVRVGGRTAWVADELTNWVESHIRQRDTQLKK